MKRFFFIFVVALIVNALWENLHAALYVNYQGGAITESILLHAAFVDAVIITVICFPFLYVQALRVYSWLIIPTGIMIAVLIEWWALGTGRWAYTAAMPIIPLLNTGLTPTIQLAFTGYFTYKVSQFLLSNSRE